MGEQNPKDMNEQARKTHEAARDASGPQSEQAVTRDTTPSVEKPGQKPTTPERPPA